MKVIYIYSACLEISAPDEITELDLNEQINLDCYSEIIIDFRYLFGLLSMGSFLSLFMILVGLFIFLKIKKDDSN